MPSAEDLLKYLWGTDGNLGNTSERRGGMAIVITRWKCVQGAKYNGCGGLVEGWHGVRRPKLCLNRNDTGKAEEKSVNRDDE